MTYQDTSFDLFAPTVTDGYKVGHRPLYPAGTTFAYSNGTFRSDRIFQNDKSKSRFWDGKVVWVGIQGALREINGLWKRSFFDKPKDAVCKRYARRMNAYLGQGAVNIECFEKLHDLGYLPIEVLSIKEGSRVNMNVPVYTVYNTVDEFFWVVNYLETLMSALLWKMTTNATIAYEYRRTFDYWAKETGVDPSYVDIQGHDFAFRGLSGPEDAARIGLGHLVVFKGTDTLPAIDYAEDMYFADVEKEFVACSVVATEHAVATSNILFNVSKMLKQINEKYAAEIERDGGGILVDIDELRAQGELEFIKEVLTEKHPSGIVSLVSDSFDFWKVITDIAPRLKDVIVNRTPDAMGFAKTVFRPDSGDPVKIICGTAYEMDSYTSDMDKVLAAGYRHARCHGRYYEYVEDDNCAVWKEVVPTAEMKGAVQCLYETFGGTETEKGFKVLHERVGLIYGDSITVQRADEILRRLAKQGFASCNIVFGIGSYTYQCNSRDTHGFAVKSTAVGVNGDLIELFKAPKTEKDTLKKSAKGFLKVVKNEAGDFVLEQENHIDIQDLAEASGELKRIFRNSEFTRTTTLKEITETLLAV